MYLGWFFFVLWYLDKQSFFSLWLMILTTQNKISRVPWLTTVHSVTWIFPCLVELVDLNNLTAHLKSSKIHYKSKNKSKYYVVSLLFGNKYISTMRIIFMLTYVPGWFWSWRELDYGECLSGCPLQKLKKSNLFPQITDSTWGHQL